MPTTMEEGVEAHEHTEYSAHPGRQSAPQPEDTLVGPTARFRQTGEWHALRGTHQDTDRECTRSAAAIAGARSGRTETEHEACHHWRRDSLHSGGSESGRER